MSTWRYRATSTALLVAGGAASGVVVGACARMFVDGPWFWLGLLGGAAMGLYDSKWWVR